MSVVFPGDNDSDALKSGTCRISHIPDPAIESQQIKRTRLVDPFLMITGGNGSEVSVISSGGVDEI